MWAPRNLPERLALASELVRLGAETNQPELSLHGYRWRIPDYLELGNVVAADADLVASEALAQESRQPLYLWHVSVFRALRAIFDGRLAEAEPLVEHAFALGSRVQPGTAAIYHGAQLFALRREQGRLGEIEGLLSGLADQYPAMPIFRAYLAYVYLEGGQLEPARRQVERLADDFLDLPRDALWLGTITILAEGCVRLGNVGFAAILRDCLLPFGDRIVVHGVPTAYGSARRYLALLAMALGRWDEADAHFDAATQINTRMGRASRRRGVVTTARHSTFAAGDATTWTGRALLQAAFNASESWGFSRLAARSRELLATVPEPQASPLSPGHLSPREMEVLRHIAAGKSNQEIADALVISLNTAIRHVSNILSKIGAANRTEAAVFAARHGLVPLKDGADNGGSSAPRT